MPHGEERENALVVHYTTLRRMLGLIGLALPVVLSLGGLVEQGRFLPSISAYANTALDEVLTGALAAIGVFLLAYRGYEPRPGEWLSDGVVARAAGLGALGVALFPIKPAFGATDWDKIADSLHYPSAGLFFLSIGTMAFFHFCRSDRPRREWTGAKKRRNALFRLLGLVIYAMTAGLIANHYGWFDVGTQLGIRNPVFWMETIAIWAFGTAWLVKGEGVSMFNDPEPEPETQIEPEA